MTQPQNRRVIFPVWSRGPFLQGAAKPARRRAPDVPGKPGHTRPAVPAGPALPFAHHQTRQTPPRRNRSGKWTQKKIISCLSLSEIETTRHVVNSSVTQEELRLDSSKGDMEPFEPFAPDWMRYVFLPQNTGGARGECSPGTGRRLSSGAVISLPSLNLMP